MGRARDDGDAALREVADALYAAPSAGFVARRAAAVKEARIGARAAAQRAADRARARADALRRRADAVGV